MLLGDRAKRRGWGKRGDSKQALRAAVVETLEERRMLAGYGDSFYVAHGGGASIGVSPDGGCIVTWIASDHHGYAQRYDASGRAMGGNIRVSNTSGYHEAWDDIAVAADGSFTVTWEQDNLEGNASLGIFARRFNASGVALGDAFCVDSNFDAEPSIAMSPDGSFAIAYSRVLLPGYYRGAIFVRRYDSNGLPLGDEQQVSYDTLGSYARPAIAMSAGGQMVVAWPAYSYGSSNVFGRVYNASGQPLGAAFQLNAESGGSKYEPSVAVDASGNWVATWMSGTSDTNILVRRFDSNGTPLDTVEQHVNTGACGDSADVAMDSSGRVIVTWGTYANQSYAIYGRMFGNAGDPIGLDFPIAITNCPYAFPVVSMDAAGAAAVAWQTYDGTYAVCYGPNVPPSDIALSNSNVTESASGTLIGNLDAVDADASDRFTYSLAAGVGDDDLFQIVGNELRSINGLDFETKATRDVTIVLRNSSGWSIQRSYAITITDVNEAPGTVFLTNLSTRENQPTGTLVGRLSGSDQDAGDTLTFALASGEGDTDNSAFQVVGNELRTASVLNFEGKKNLSVRLRVTDAGGLWYEKAVVINVSNANDGPTGIDLTGRAVTEQQPGGTPVGVLSAADEDASETFTYALVGGDGDTDNSSFAIDGQTLKTALGFVYTPTVSYQIRVRVTDSGGLFREVPFTLGTTPWRPTLSAGGPYQVNEGQVLALNASVSNSVFSSYAYQWDFNYDGQTFDADATGQTPVFSAADIDGTTTRTIALRVRADNGAVSDVVSTTVSITNVAPTASFAAGNTVPGGNGTVTFAGATDASAADRAAGFYYSYDFDNDGIFEIEGSSLATVTVPSTYIPNAGSYPMRGRVTDQNGGSRDYTASLVVRALPVALAGGPYGVVEDGTVGLNGTAQNLQSPSQAAYEWDLNYDGQSFDVDATGQTPMFSAAALSRGDSRTIALRVRDGDGTVSIIATSTVSVTNTPPQATFASGGNVTLGMGGTVAFSNVRDSAADLAAGMRYFYDFNNDGVFEVRKSTSPTCQVPASYLTTPGKHTVRARIKDSGGLYTDFTAKIPVNVPPDYYPFVPGLQWQLAGQEDGVSYTETDSIVADTYNGQSVFRCHFDERKSGSTDLFDEYVLWNGTGFDTLGGWYPSSSADEHAASLLLGAPIPLWSEALAAGGALTWSNIPMTLAYTDYPSTTEPLRASGQSSGSIQFVRFEDVTLSNGLHFKNALVVQQSTTMTLNFTDRGVQITVDQSITDTAWFVRGLGCIKEEESDSARTHASNGYDKTENSTDRFELSSLPAWANYLSFAGDVLQVNGTDGADTISFEVRGANLTCYRNGVPQSVPLASVHGVVINGLGGNDVVNARALWVPVTMAGGGGRDSLVGGHADDVISGGGGADTILGGGGADAISAGKGNDSVLGQGGEDSLNGGAGNDTLDGGAGDDDLVDASGANVLLGGAGADSIDARNGWRGDVIDGGSETDTVLTDVREGALNAEYCYAKTPKVPGGLATAAGAGVEGAGGVSVSWSSATRAQSYRIERSLDGSDFELLTSVPGSVLSYADSSVLGGVTYYYRICAINPIGVSAYGAAVSVTVG